MSTLDPPANPSSVADVRRPRPAGWSPGTGTLLGAWIVGVAIAQLTGATAVILLLAVSLVAITFEIVAGWWAARAVHVRSVVAPPVADVDEPFAVLVLIDAPMSARAVERRRITVALADGTAVTIDEESSAVPGPPTAPVPITVCFGTAGLVTALDVRVDVAGPAGLIWWHRTRTIAIHPLHIAPTAHGPLAETETSTSMSDGAVAARRGNRSGEIDGVRPWRHGDSTNAVHWASSLRSAELIVHDRLTAADQRWIVDLDHSDPSRLRWTLAEGRRRGHDVAVRTADGSTHAVTDDDAAAQWSAIAAQVQADHRADNRPTGPLRSGILHRHIGLRPSPIEIPTAITGTARWTAAGATFASLAMLVGALARATPILVLAFVVVGAAASLWVARRGGKRPPVVQLAIVSAVLVALLTIGAQAAEVDNLLAALRGPLPDVLMLLVLLHGFETVDRRTLRVHLAISFVLASYAAGLRIDGALGWWLAAWGALFGVSLLSTSRQPLVDHAVTRGHGDPLRRTVAGSVRRSGPWIASLAAIGAATLAVLSLIPIPDGPARLGLPALSSNAPIAGSPGGLARPDGSAGQTGGQPDLDREAGGDVVGYPGFTETLDTRIRGDLGDDIVMRVRAPEAAFWRGQTFTEFDGQVWTASPDLGQPQDGPMIDVQPAIGDAIGTTIPSDELVQTYFVEQDHPNVVFAAPRPVQVIFDGSLWTRPDGALRSDVTLTAGSVYTVISQRPRVDADILRAQGDLGEFYSGFRERTGGVELDPFLELPASTTQRTVELATTLRTPGESTYDTLLAYETWLGANTQYDLEAPVPAAGADAVDDFLFESKLGFCEQIASALTIMLRSQGVPARLATGYVSGERDRVSGVWNVRSRDAHAWVEVWFPQTGWQQFDPTADVPLAADAGGNTVGGDLIGAMVASVVSHRIEIGLALLAAGTAWGLVHLVGFERYRRQRGRWGLLQDRFDAFTDTTATNARIASTFADPAQGEAARTIADELDRAGFDPSWVDDDDRYDHVRSALATLERSKR